METNVRMAGQFFDSANSLSYSPDIFSYITLGVFILIFLAFLSGAEVAILSTLQKIRSHSQDIESSKSKTIFNWADNPDYFKIQFKNVEISIKFILILLCAVSFFSFTKRWEYILLYIFSVVFLYLILTEFVFKTLAEAYPEKYVLLSLFFLKPVFVVFTPVNRLSYNFENWLVKQRIKRANSELANELSNSIEHASDNYSDEEDIVKGIVKFGYIDVSQILKPRVDVVAVEYNNTLTSILQVVIDSGYSRIPVYNGNFDNVAGILYVKDLLPHIHSKDDFEWQSLMRQPYFVPDSKKVKELLNEFKVNKIHMAVVVDEYGGTLGIVTLEDILEEIVGEISDESDEEEKLYTKVNEYTYIFNAKILLNDFYKILHCSTEVFDAVKGEADTLAGLILEIKGEIPDKNEEIVFKDYLFKIEAVDSRRIKQIRVIINNE